MQYGIFSQNQWLFPDSSAEGGSDRGALTLLRGQTGGLQMMVEGLTVGAPLSATVTGLDGVDVTAERHRDVCVNRNTNDLQCGLLTSDRWEDVKRDRVRRAPYRAYDPLVPLQGLCAEHTAEAFYFTFVPAIDATPGVRNGTVTLCAGKDSVSFPVSVTVCSKALPERTLNLTNWPSISAMAWAHNVEYGSEEHIELFRRYTKTMTDCHQNLFWITFDDLKASKVDGRIVFDFSGVKRWADLALECGITTLEWCHIITRPTWEDPPFRIPNLTVNRWMLDCLSTEGRKYLTAFLSQFNDFLTENGWREISVVHISDEPKERCADDFRILAGIFRKYLPGIKLIDAIEIYFIEDALDIYVPKDHYFQQNRNDFEALRDERNELWFYTCNMPGGRFLNRHIDAPLLNTRLLHWGNYYYNLTGYLHWGYNQYRKDADIFEQTSANAQLPAGECNIVYPDADRVLLSLRYKEMKCGVEDYEILHALSLLDKDAADRICRKAFYAFDDYVTDVATFDRIHLELVEAYENA